MSKDFSDSAKVLDYYKMEIICQSERTKIVLKYIKQE